MNPVLFSKRGAMVIGDKSLAFNVVENVSKEYKKKHYLEKVMEVQHTKIECETICKNGSERYGAMAKCSFTIDDQKLWIDVSQHGKTKIEAIQKLKDFLSSNGKIKITEVP